MNRLPELPIVIAEIADVAGLDVAWKIVEARGGQQVFIPAKASLGHWLTDLVGVDAAAKICDHYRINGRGDDIVIPMASAARRLEAWRQVIESDMKVNEIAARLGVHRRTVFRHRRRVEDERQGKLPF